MSKHLPRLQTSHALFILGVGLVLLRAPQLFIEPRFWAEEGKFFFAEAFKTPWYESLFQARFGYLNLYANAATMIATWVPLLWAPLVTTLFSLLVYLLLIGKVAFSQGEPWVLWQQKLLGILMVLFTGLTAELWLNSINSMTYLGLFSFLVLVSEEDIKDSRSVIWNSFWLLIAGLSGLLSCMLTPAFIYRYWWRRKKEDLIFLSAMVFSSVVQGFLILQHMHSPQAGAEQRLTGMSIATFCEIVWNKVIILPVFGLEISQQFFDFFNQWNASHKTLIGVGIGTMAGLLLIYFLSSMKTQRRWMCILSLAIVCLVSFNATNGDKNSLVHPQVGHRYFLLPAFIFMFIVYSNIDWAHWRRPKSLAALFFFAAFILSIPLKYHSDLFTDPSLPKWREEVKKWEQDPKYELKIWPEGWTMRL